MTLTTTARDDRTAAIAADADAADPDAPLAHAVVGLGRFGRVHALKLLSLRGFELRAVVDCSAPACANAALSALAALPVLRALDELPPGIASATVATSDPAHAEVALALMRRGCHVLVEKPLCLDRHEGALMIRTARQCGVTLGTGHIERFNPVFDDACLARLRAAATHHRHNARPFMRFHRHSSRAATAWDSVLDLMVHDIDLFAWLCAIPVEAPLEVLSRHVGEHSVRARVRLGALVAEFESGYGPPPASARLQVGHGDGTQWLDLRGTHPATADDALARQYQGFRRAVLGQPSRVASGADGLAAVTRACQVLHAG